jgi:hypothetical protein
MTPMFPEGENNRLCAHAARAEPVYKSSSGQQVLGSAPEGFALHREPSAGAMPVPADAGRGAYCPGLQSPRTSATPVNVRLVIFSDRCASPVKGFLTAPSP